MTTKKDLLNEEIYKLINKIYPNLRYLNETVALKHEISELLNSIEELDIAILKIKDGEPVNLIDN